MNIDEAMEKAGADLDAAAPPETEPAPVTEAPPVEVAPAEDPAKADGRERNPDGTFKSRAPEKPGKPGEAARKPAGTPAVQGAKGTATEQPPAAAAPPPVPEKSPEPKPRDAETVKSWSSTARDAFRELSSRIPQELAPLLKTIESANHRRDLETTRVLNETAQERQFNQGVRQSLSVYAPIAQANGKDVMTWAGEGLQTYAALMQGAPEAAVNAAAQAVRVLTQRFGPQAVDMLVAAVEGKGAPLQAPHPPVDVAALVQKQLDERIAKLTEERQMASTRAWLEANADKPDLDEVFPAMVGIVQAATQRGEKITLDDAYTQARWANPTSRQRLMAEAEAEKAKQRTAQAQQARAAAGQSLRSSSAPPATRPAKMTEAAALELAAQKHGF